METLRQKSIRQRDIARHRVYRHRVVVKRAAVKTSKSKQTRAANGHRVADMLAHQTSGVAGVDAVCLARHP